MSLRHFYTNMWRATPSSSSSSRPTPFSPATLLKAIASEEPRFGRRNQHDAHELFICLVNEIKNEEVKRIKKEEKEKEEKKKQN
eukprot:CAMPEP_0201538266 /NCGR_PEP_ID=MMETSP0161_2-20130828/67123_1 /ASSEMBLY_ACC=CAM_ASM_000251 /TAXON_ID=180227 /ORGANISM="Neoparamoeba aestuarina, Strain SoJaBio B1-5/56/2" /LENGTH=83 /DNA_ID=CAMNT_0047945015 /DNA_START=68 /DNA_END=316 /DNA_ORIENTATION=-